MTEAGLPLLRLPESLADGVILLDAHRPEDAETHWREEDEEMRRRFDAIRPPTLDETRTAIARWIDGRAAGSPMFAYALREPSGRLVGGCELRMRSADGANLSYWLFPAFRGRGYAVRAVAMLCRAAASVEGLRWLKARIAPDNASSRRVAEKAGFVAAGMVEEKAWTGVTSLMMLYVRPVAVYPIEETRRRIAELKGD
jgi:RimJ/RimL family protein N-acetyltransferase